MNIFVIDSDPQVSASYLDIKRKNKMLIESTQMLSTAIICYGGDAPYKSTHVNHPCSIWVRKSYKNFEWLYKYALCLGDNYNKRTGKIHKTHDVLLREDFIAKAKQFYPKDQYIAEMTQFVNCTKDFKHIDNTFEAYKLQLEKKWGEDKIKPVFDVFC